MSDEIAWGVKLLHTIQKRTHGSYSGWKVHPHDKLGQAQLQVQPIHDSVTEGGELTAPRSGRFIPDKDMYLLYIRLDRPRGPSGRLGKPRPHWDSIFGTSSLFRAGKRVLPPL